MKILAVLFLILIFMPQVNSETLADDTKELLENKLKGPIAPLLEEKLPIRPADLRDGTKEIDKELEKLIKETKKEDLKLSGELEKGAVVSNAELIKDSPLSRYKGKNLMFFRITVANNSKQPMLILGAQSSFSQETANKVKAPPPLKSLDASTLEMHDNNLLTPKKKAILGLASLSTAGMAGPLTYEFLTPTENRKRSLGIALGRDRGRHEVEDERFGLRLIMPSDNTSGWAAFDRSSYSQSTAKIYVPIMYPPYTKISEILVIPIGKNPKISSMESFDSK